MVSQVRAAASQSIYQASSHSVSAVSERTQTSSFHKSARSKRLVQLSDHELADMALATKRSIDWRSIVLSARNNPEFWKWQELENGFTMFTRLYADRFAVLVVGLVPGYVAEVLNILQSPSAEEFTERKRAIFEGELRDGAVIHRADLEEINGRASIKLSQTEDSKLAELVVKRMAFNKKNWLSSHEDWCYLNAVYRSKQDTVIEKIVTTLNSSDVLVDAFGGGKVGSSVNAVHDVICGYLLRAGAHDSEVGQEINGDKPSGATPRETRVSFYAEYRIPQRDLVQVALASDSSGWRRYVEASTHTITRRLTKLGATTARLTTLVRRQRLGLQPVLEIQRYTPPTQAPCKLCARIVLLSKLCQLCGHDVCSKCSAKYERARLLSGRKLFDVTVIRVCADCIKQVDQAEYTELMSSWLLDESPTAGSGSVVYTPKTSGQDIPIMAVSPASSLATCATSHRDLASTTQLEILCDLAARELGCSAVIITVIARDQFVVVASSLSRLREAHISRTESPLAMVEHGTMIISHGQTALRFSAGGLLQEMTVRFICAHPLVGADDQVIGSMCCLHGDSINVTDTQVAQLKKLSLTASRVFRMEIKP